MRVSIHQPNYLPYIGFFNKIKNSDIFVLLDTAQYVKNDFHNRNRIRTPDGHTWLTIPIRSEDCYLKRICDVKLPDDNEWAERHWKSIEMNYKKAKYFELYKDFFEELYTTKHGGLAELNEKIIRHLVKQFNLGTKIVKASELNTAPDLRATDLLINILQEVGASSYLSGRGRASKEHYIEEEKFHKANIKLEYQRFVHPVYQQRFKGCIENLSAIDLLFNMGEKSGSLI